MTRTNPNSDPNHEPDPNPNQVLELRREQQAANAARASDRRRAALADNIDERLPPQTPVEEMKE